MSVTTPVFATKLNIVRPVLPPVSELQESIERIFATKMVTKGPYLAEFERDVASHLGVRNAVALSSCTTGLMLTFKALGLTGEVVVPSFTFMATVSAIVWAGLTPVFADVRLTTTNLDPEAAERAITPKTSAIVAVHNFGNPAEIEALEAIAKRHNLRLIFDAAHGFGSLYRGVPVGRQGDASSFSLSPTKLLVAGEGGIVATESDELARLLRIGREYGMENYNSVFPGINARMPELNALIGLHSLRRLELAARNRNAYALRYNERLSRLPGVTPQEVEPRDRCSYKDYSIVIDAAKFGMDRDQLAAALAEENIDSRKYYAPAVHKHPPYAQYVREDTSLPVTGRLERDILSLPIWSEMPDDVIDGICTTIERLAGR